MRYTILDPTGNITALVESEVDPTRRIAAAAEIMSVHPEVEQVGFVRFFPEEGDDHISCELNMAGGEFCGNASMCAAVLYYLRDIRDSSKLMDQRVRVRLDASGAADPVEVGLIREKDDSFRTSIIMPSVPVIRNINLTYETLNGVLPTVDYEGISHLVIEPDSVFFSLLSDPVKAEFAAKSWCGEMKADGLGLMFLQKDVDGYRLTPLVCVSRAETMFWEHSCASGSAAVGVYLASKSGLPVSITLHEPGGDLRVESDPSTGKTRLHGQVRFLKAFYE